MPMFETAEENPDILDAELHTDSRLRYIQRRLQDEDGTRLSIDSIAYVLQFGEDFEKLHGRG